MKMPCLFSAVRCFYVIPVQAGVSLFDTAVCHKDSRLCGNDDVKKREQA
jgi:hypothetical protein